MKVHFSPVRIALIYAAFGVVWILLSDSALHALVQDGELENRLQTVKGWFFILVTGGLIYWLARQSTKRFETLVRERTSQLENEIVERQYAEKSLKDTMEYLEVSEQRLRNMLESSPIGIVVVSRHTRKRVYVNSRFLELYGFASKADALDANITISFARSVDDDYVNEKLKCGEDVIGAEVQRIRKDGTMFWARMDSRLMKFEGDDCMIWWHYDITNRKEAEQKLSAERRLINMAIEFMPPGVVVRDVDDNIVLFNNRILDLVGAPRELFENNTSSRNMMKLFRTMDYAGKVPSETENKIDAWINARLNKEPMADFSYQRKGVNEKTLMVDFRSMEDGYEIRTFNDITDLKRAEDLLRRNSEIVDLLRTTATDANQSIDFDGALQNCLDTICAFAGWPVGHAYARDDMKSDFLKPTKIWHLDEPERFNVFRKITEKTELTFGSGLVSKVFESRKPIWIENVIEDPKFSRVKTAEGDLVVRSGFALPVLSQETVVAVLEFYTDEIVEQDDELLGSLIHIGVQLGRVFERKQAEMEIRLAMNEIDRANQTLELKVETRTRELLDTKNEADHAKIEAETANQAKTEFLGNMSHELRTPLNAIIGFSEIIKDALFGQPILERYQDYAKDINASGEHLLGIISDVLDVLKVEAGEFAIEKEKVDMTETVVACETMISGRVKQAGVTLTFNMAVDLPPINADPLRLKQVLLNLIGNAIKFTPKGGLITVNGEVNGGGGVKLKIKDTGIGIAKDDIPKALEKFGQVRDGHTHAHEGAGLGLFLANSLMEQRGGSLEIESEVAKGTTVTVTFPPGQK